VAEATSAAIERIGQSIEQPGGANAVSLQVAEKYVEAFSKLAKENNTMIVPASVSDASGVIATAMSVINKTNASNAAVTNQAPN